MTQSFTHIICSSYTQFTQTDLDTNYTTVFTLDQITEFIQFDYALHRESSNPSLAGYFNFTHIYNLEPNVHTKFSMFDNHGSIISSSPQKGLQSVIPGGSTDETTAWVMSTPIPRHKNKKPYPQPNTPVPHNVLHPASPSTAPLLLPGLPGFMLSNLTPSQMLIVGEVMLDKLSLNLHAKH
ncbi:hypothetical protein BDN71DRAFT_1427580 [Pleurotus eryngii]|uniref:Uncharacterized protein n=1 Tax=Pleurotus eryngii TaxID=5323 RepID=A0A9P6DJ44_PLEER|nr:hypothetical protein BDN71DRAFT_1427580 [Pleurotus eryngii]